MRTSRIPNPASTAASAVAALALLAIPAGAQQTDVPYDRLAASKLIVKFRDGTPIAAAAQHAAADPGADRGLAEALARLTRDLGVVLRAERLTSGGELVVELDRAALGRTIAETLARQDAIAAAEPVPEPVRIRPASALSVRIRPAPGADSEALRSALGSASRELGSTLVLSPAEATESGSPEASISIGHLMARIESFLRERPEVEYAQLDRPVRTFGGF